MFTHVDLFSGIAGFALAAREVWGDDYENVCFCDNNKFCQAVIRKNFGKGSVIIDDIREVTRERIIADTQRMRKLQSQRFKQDIGGRTINGIDLLTGGFPCQPFSQAGKRKGTSDNRHLWPEMLRVIEDLQPRWVIGENVRGILTIEQGMVFEQVCLELERASYSVQAFVIPACAVNAPHRRDRVWIVAHSASNRRYGEGSGATSKKGLQPGPEYAGKLEGGLKRPHSDAPDTENEGLERRVPAGTRRPRGWPTKYPISGKWRNEIESWNRSWLDVAYETCARNGRVDDGPSKRIHGFTEAGHRVERLKALGNAIVPQVAIEIMRAIKEVEKCSS